MPTLNWTGKDAVVNHHLAVPFRLLVDVPELACEQPHSLLATPSANEVNYRVMNEQPNIIIIAGPNGAGKTTFAREFLPHEANCPTFINADLIAQGIAPFLPDTAALKAGRIMLGMMRDCVRRRESFAFETTMSGRTYAKLIPTWKEVGYRIVIFFLELPSVELAIARVANRVAQGGHNIPEAVIRRRFTAGKKNFLQIYKLLADEWRHYDSSSAEPIIIESSTNNL